MRVTKLRYGSAANGSEVSKLGTLQNHCTIQLITVKRLYTVPQPRRLKSIEIFRIFYCYLNKQHSLYYVKFEYILDSNRKRKDF